MCLIIARASAALPEEARANWEERRQGLVPDTEETLSAPQQRHSETLSLCSGGGTKYNIHTNFYYFSLFFYGIYSSAGSE